MTTNQEYWQRRYLQTKAKEIRNTEACERALQPQLDGLFRELSAETSKWVDKYAKNQGIDSDAARKALAGIHTKHWELTLKQFREKAKVGGYDAELDAEYFRSRVARLQSLEQQLRSYAQPHAQDLTNSMRKELTDQYNDTYMRTNYNLQAQRANFSADFARFNDAQLRIAVSQPWGKDGKDFSQRIWKNYQRELPSYLMDAVLRGTIMGYGPQKVTQMMHARFQDVKRNNVHRLVVSEMAHVAEEANVRAYEENEIEQYEYMATLESHTCDVCARLDGQIFKVSERRPGVNYPIMHGRCRCTTVPYIKGLPEVGERWSREPKTGKGKLVENVTFKEWKAMVNGDKAMPIPFVNKQQTLALGVKLAEQVNETLNRAPQPFQRLWQQKASEVKIRTLSDDGSNYYQPGSHYVQLSKKQIASNTVTAYQNPRDVIFHEIGHAIDFASGDPNKTGLVRMLGSEKAARYRTPISNETLSFGLTLDSDYKAMQSTITNDYLERFPAVKDVGQGFGEWMGRVVKLNKDGSISKVSARKSAMMQWAEEVRQEIAEDQKNGSKLNAAASWSDLSDMLDAQTKGKINFGYGHPKSYWKTSSSKTAEAFAEMTSATINNPKSLANIKKYFPNSYKEYLKIVSGIIKEGD